MENAPTPIIEPEKLEKLRSAFDSFLYQWRRFDRSESMTNRMEALGRDVQKAIGLRRHWEWNSTEAYVLPLPGDQAHDMQNLLTVAMGHISIMGAGDQDESHAREVESAIFKMQKLLGITPQESLQRLKENFAKLTIEWDVIKRQPSWTSETGDRLWQSASTAPEDCRRLCSGVDGMCVSNSIIAMQAFVEAFTLGVRTRQEAEQAGDRQILHIRQLIERTEQDLASLPTQD